MYCKNCGNNIPDNVSFCSKCGNPVSQQVAASEIIQKKKSGKTGVIVAIVILFVIFIIVGSVILSGYMSTKQMRDALATNDAYLINETYSQARNDPKLIQKYDELIVDTLDAIIEDINSCDFSESAKVNADVDYEDYVCSNWGDFVVDPESFSDSIISKNESKWNEMINLFDAKESYYIAIYDYTNGDYESALSGFAFAGEFDDAETYLSDCINGYISVVSEDAQTLIDSGDVSGGIELLTSAKERVGVYGTDSTEINDMINSTLSTYAAQYAKKAETAFMEHDVEGAIGNIEVAIELQPDNVEYKTKLDTYNLYKPYALYIEENCILIEGDEAYWGTLGFDVKMQSNNGQEMYHCIKWYNNNDDINAAEKAIYDLNGLYDTVSGVIFLSEYDKNTDLSGYFEVYGDGALLYTSETMTGGVNPKEFEFSVSGIQRLTVSFHGEGTGGFLGVGPDFGISNLIAQKAFPEQ